MNGRNSTREKDNFEDGHEVQPRIFESLSRPQSTYMTQEDRFSSWTKMSPFRNVRNGNNKIIGEFDNEEHTSRPQLGNSSDSFRNVKCGHKCERQFPLPLAQSTTHCIMPVAQRIPYLATNTYVPNHKMLFERNTHAHKEIYTEVIPKTVDIASYKLPSFLPVFSGMLNRRRRREHRPRRQRTTFSTEQTIKLEIEYGRAEYISRSRRYELAELLNLSENQIKIWFQNRRAKEKRIEKAQLDQNIRHVSFNHFFRHEFQVPKCSEMCEQCNLSTMKIRQDNADKS